MLQRTTRKMQYLPLVMFLVALGFFIFSIHIAQVEKPDFSLHSFLFPAVAGLSMTIAGGGLFYYLFPHAGLVALLWCHFFIGIFLIFSAAPFMSTPLNLLKLICLMFVPPTLIHSTFLISETLVDIKTSIRFYRTLYWISVLVALPCFYFLLKNQTQYIILQTSYFILIGFAYLLWLGRLGWNINSSQPEIEKIIARYLLLAQVVIFLLPIIIVVIIILIGITIPLHVASLSILLFPIALFAGIIPGQKRQSQTYIVQSEKRVAFGGLLSGLAHELNNPLTFVHSSLEPLRDSLEYLKGVITNPDERTTKVFRNLDKMIFNMEDGMSRAQKLIEQFRHIPSGKRPEKEDIDVVELLNNCIDLLAHKWQNKLEIERNLIEVPKILGVKMEIEQAFTNLIANACDATPEGGRVQISTHEASAGIKVVIRDTGKGIPREIIGKIFDPFFTTKGQGEGQGLGLAITQQIIKNHRGTIEVKSEEGKGTEFLVMLPY